MDSSIDASASAPPGHWSTYPVTVARRIARDFGGDLRGADIAFASDLPIAAGVSSSSALVVATFLVLAHVNALALEPMERLAAYLGAVESGYAFGDFAGDSGVGTFGGSEDHTAILCARPNALVQYSFCPVRFEREVPLPHDHAFVIASSGVVAEKIGAVREQYNELSRSAQRIAERWRAISGRNDVTLGDLLASGPDAVEQTLHGIDVPLRDRFTQFVLESTELIPAAGDALAAGDLVRLGQIVDRSFDAAERLLRNQVPETMWLVRDARARGAVAASAFGAGFGGSVWALVPAERAESFRETWAEEYARRFPGPAAHSEFFTTRAGSPAMRL
ncbi:MAG TPA: hypothetical protein VHP37_17560 [Burkholderiales bacterium]|nr:hypothetical protein [Burkholderiales bacterium]